MKLFEQATFSLISNSQPSSSVSCLLPKEKRPFIFTRHMEGCQSLYKIHQWCTAGPREP